VLKRFRIGSPLLVLAGVLVPALASAFALTYPENRVGGIYQKSPAVFGDLSFVSDGQRPGYLDGYDGMASGSLVAPKSVVTREGRLQQLVDDTRVSSADQGWIRSEMRQVEAGNRGVLRNPPGKDLRHPAGRANAQGFDYTETQLQDRATHRTQHRYLVERSTETTIRIPKKPPKPGPELPE
jgi:hypothetical protein